MGALGVPTTQTTHTCQPNEVASLHLNPQFLATKRYATMVVVQKCSEYLNLQKAPLYQFSTIFSYPLNLQQE